jgi:hypothetical protein
MKVTEHFYRYKTVLKREFLDGVYHEAVTMNGESGQAIVRLRLTHSEPDGNPDKDTRLDLYMTPDEAEQVAVSLIQKSIQARAEQVRDRQQAAHE